MAIIQLENAKQSWTKRIGANSVQVNGNKQNDNTPDQETGEVTNVTENTFENPVYTVQGWQLSPDVSNALTYSDVLDIHTSTDTELYLIVKYGGDDSPIAEKTLPSTQSAYTAKIPVKLQQWNITLSTGNAAAAYIPSGTMTFVETKGANT